MSTVSKSPWKVATVALAVGKRSFPKYGHRFSRQDYTLAQLFALLVLKQFFTTDYRGIVAIVKDWRELQELLGLKKVPNHSTLHKAAQRHFSADRYRRLIHHTVGLYHGDDADAQHAHHIEQAAVDGTGFETHQASRYFVRRRSRSPGNIWQTTCYRDFGKLIIAVDCATHLILAQYTGKGPRPDVDQFEALLAGWCDNAVPEQLLADAGFDSQFNHQR
jgi:hypothetical protein